MNCAACRNVAAFFFAVAAFCCLALLTAHAQGGDYAVIPSGRAPDNAGVIENSLLTPDFTSVVVVKLDATTGRPLNGFQMSLFDNPECVGDPLAEGTTGDDGQGTVKLPLPESEGDFFVKESGFRLNVIDFEAFERGNYPTTLLASEGIADMIVAGPPGVGGPQIRVSHDVPPGVYTATSGRNFFWQRSLTPEPHSLTLLFNRPLVHFGFSRISTAGGGSSIPKWLAEAFSADGMLLDSVSEEKFQVSVPAASFDLFAPPGETITSVRITSDNRLTGSPTGWSTFHSAPLDDFELTIPFEDDFTLISPNCQPVDVGDPPVALLRRPATLPPCPDGKECDEFGSGAAIALVMTIPPLGIVSASVSGPTKVAREPVDDKDSDGLDDVKTEILFMELTGTSRLGPLKVVTQAQTPREPNRLSQGEIEERFNQTAGELEFAADRFFDFLFEIETSFPPPNDVLHNIDPLRLQCVTLDMPPLGCLYFSPGGFVPRRVVNAANQRVGFLVPGAHWPGVPAVIFRNLRSEKKILREMDVVPAQCTWCE
ncbi:MAG: hypothetical protein ACE5LU_03100 [Anaerolineae bacterium]